MAIKTIEASPQGYARLAGAIYLFVILFGGFSEGYVMSALVVPGDVAATGRRILAAPDLWRISVAGNLVVPMIAIVQLWIEYLLLKPVSRHGALLFLLLNLASLAVEAVSKVFLLMIAPLLAGSGFAHGLAAPQALALAAFALGAHNISFLVTLILFVLACLVSGWLIWRSRYLPSFLGALMQVAGVCYLVASFSDLFFPTLADLLSPWILLPPLVGETSLCLWLLIKGLDVKAWRERFDTGG